MKTSECPSDRAAAVLSPCHHLSLFRAIVANMKAAVLVATYELEVYAANELFLAMFGLDGSVVDVVGRDLHDSIRAWSAGAPTSAALFSHAFAMVDTCEPVVSETFALDDGRLIEIDFTPVHDEDDSVRGFMWQFQDVTSAKLAETALRDSDVTARRTLEEQLRQAHKMEAVGRLAGGVAHDFNNLLTIISGSAELGILDASSNDPLVEYLVDIADAAQRGSNLTRQLLSFSRRQLVEPREVDLGNLLLDTERMLRRLIGEDIDLRIRIAADVRRVLVDPGQFEQVVINLATNARDAMLDGGTLTIEAKNVEVSRRNSDLHAGIPVGAFVILSVTDTGSGMDETTQAHIFEPFFTTKEDGRGTGLGLAITYGIVARNNGHIQVHSEEGVGTTFRIYLPTVEKRSEIKPQAPESPREHVASGTVLVVEDEETVRKLVSAMLRTAGYDVIVAADGQTAIEIADSHRGPIHALLSDVVLPKMNGAELAERISRIRPGIRVLYMSGYAQGALERHGIAGSDIAYIQKPFTPAALAGKMRDVLAT